MATMENTISMEKKKKEPGKIAQAINSYFHVYDRGTTIKSEIGAGISAFLVACAAFILNAQVIGSVYGNYAGSYLAVTLLAFLGTLLLGILCNRPLVQCSNLALSTAIVSMISANTGVTYANMMAITFISAIISLIIIISPLGKKLSDLMPLAVRKALPVAIGLFTMMQGLQYSGLVSNNTLATIGEFDMQGMYTIMMLLAILVYVIMRVMKVRKSALRIFGVLVGLMWAFGILFFMSDFIGGQTATTLIYQRFNVIVKTDGADAYNIALGFSSINWGQCFTSGFDFSAFTANGGNVALLFIKGIVVYTLLGLLTNTANLHSVAVTGGFLNDDHTVENERRVYLISAATNVVAPLLGAPINTVSTSSAVMTNDEVKTGLSSVVASIGFFICMFTWAVFALTATETHGVGMWIESSETKLAAYVQDVFAFANLIVVLAASRMLTGLKDLDTKNIREMIPFIATLAGSLILSDVAFGIALGLVFDLVIALCQGKKEEVTNPTKLATTGVMALYLVFAIL